MRTVALGRTLFCNAPRAEPGVSLIRGGEKQSELSEFDCSRVQVGIRKKKD